MSFVRPELLARVRPWRESFVWAVTLALGLSLVWRGLSRGEPLVLVAGSALAATGFALLRASLARMLLEAPTGPGVAVVDEGRIEVWGPQGGGFVDLPALVAVEVTGVPGTADRAWVLRSEDGNVLVIPFGAAGAERLPDGLAALPGIDFDAAGRGGAGTVWRRDAPRVARR